jgi:hypothetical protein
MKTIDFGEEYVSNSGVVAPRPHGFDLDFKCTGLGEGPSCVMPAFASGDDADLEGGRDNAFGKFVAEMAQRVPSFGTPSFSEQIAQGKISLLFRVHNWNGQPNDDQVELTLFATGPLNALGGPSVPQWDGNDAWPIADASLVDDDISQPRFVDANAYVVSGTLVAAMPEVSLRISVGITATIVIEQLLPLQQVFFVAEIKQNTNGLYVLEKGEIAGRLHVDALLNQTDRYPDPLNLRDLPPICMDSASYQTFRSLICGFVDIHATLASPTLPCDALSVGIGFTASQARLGPIYRLPPLADRCPGEPADSCFIPFPPPDGG